MSHESHQTLSFPQGQWCLLCYLEGADVTEHHSGDWTLAPKACVCSSLFTSVRYVYIVPIGTHLFTVTLKCSDGSLCERHEILESKGLFIVAVRYRRNVNVETQSVALLFMSSDDLLSGVILGTILRMPYRYNVLQCVVRECEPIEALIICYRPGE